MDPDFGSQIVDQIPLAGPIASALLGMAWVGWKVGGRLIEVLMEMNKNMAEHNSDTKVLVSKLSDIHEDVKGVKDSLDEHRREVIEQGHDD